jgi:3',5'-cyclic AMP phosphodiesterase CpdA
MKIVQITDTHIRAPGERIYGLDPSERLAAVIEDINRRQADADLAVITGDLTDIGDPKAYTILKELLRELRIPYRLLLGNHDRRPAFRAVFPEHPTDTNGFVQSYLDAPGRVGRLLFLDSQEDGRIGGYFCARRLAWVADRLDEAADRPVAVFLHHPPLPLGVPHFAGICMADPEPFLELLREHPGGVRQIVFGHVHIAVSGIYPGGLPFSGGRSCNHHIVLDFNRPDVDWAAGGPNYNVIELGEETAFVHAFDLLHAEIIGRGAPCPGP